jgi:hypothetical protein
VRITEAEGASLRSKRQYLYFCTRNASKQST